MATVSSISQYYNLYDSTKGYTEILFRAGKVLQSKEVNEMQSMLKNQIKNVGDTILTNGDIIEGCQLVISDDRKSVTVTDGKAYLNGDVRKVSATTLTITGEGTEVIGIKLEEEVITPDEDSDLLDIATGYDNYAQDGAYRKKEVVVLTVDDEDASALYTLIDGQQMSINTSEDLTQLDKINATLARRTFDESGNYKVEGLELRPRDYADEDNVYLTIESGRAYVRGYEVNKTAATVIPIERAKSLRDVSNEPKVFRNGTLRYALNNYYPNKINRVVATVEVTDTRVRDSIIGGIDYIDTTFTPVVEIVEVKQGTNVFVQGTDYQLTNDGIDWSLNGAEPNPGETYTVTWRYNKTMNGPTTAAPDYILDYDSDTDIGYLQYTDDGDKPVVGTTVLVNYNYMLCRRDLVALDKDGNPVVTQGQPDILRTVESPRPNNEDTLVLGSILVVPNSTDITVINNNTQAIGMLDLYNMLERINNVELNQAISDLDNEAAEGELATQLEGILTDGFIGVSKADLYHDEWNASIDIDYQKLVLPFSTAIGALVPDEENNYKAATFGRLMTAPYEEIKLFSQPIATDVIRVNSYNAFPKSPSVKLSPEVDNWIDNKTITLNGGVKTTTITLRRWWYHKNASWAASEKALWQSYGFADGGESLGWSNGTRTVTMSQISSVVRTAIAYMRQIKVTVKVDNLIHNADNVVATFNGVPINLTASAVQYTGTKAGTLKANIDGHTEGYFTIPANTPCGTRELVIYAENTPTLTGRANFTANGTTVTTTKTVWTQRVKVTSSDPLAQSFQFDLDQFLTGVGIYFKDKDITEPITIQVRDMVNGYPGTTIYAEKVVLPSDVQHSSNASKETIVKFDDPVYCNADEQYCFTILSNSDVDSLFTAQTSSKDLSTGAVVTKNVYLNGMLFSSSNALTWTAHQSTDLKFNLYGARFETSGQVYFGEFEDVSFDRIMICSEESIPVGCSLKWQFAINDGDYMPIESFVERELSEFAEKVKVKLDIAASGNTSPAIALDCLQLAGFKNENTGTYVSKNVAVASGFNTVKVVADLCIPAGCNINVYYATDTSGTDWVQMTSTSNRRKSTDYTEYTFEDTLAEVAHNYRVKVTVSNNNSINRPSVMNLKSIMKTV